MEIVTMHEISIASMAIRTEDIEKLNPARGGGKRQILEVQERLRARQQEAVPRPCFWLQKAILIGKPW